MILACLILAKARQFTKFAKISSRHTVQHTSKIAVGFAWLWHDFLHPLRYPVVQIEPMSFQTVYCRHFCLQRSLQITSNSNQGKQIHAIAHKRSFKNQNSFNAFLRKYRFLSMLLVSVLSFKRAMLYTVHRRNDTAVQKQTTVCRGSAPRHNNTRLLFYCPKQVA